MTTINDILRHLFADHPPPLPPGGDPHVFGYQVALGSLGYAIPQSGLDDEQTKEAVKRFQRFSGIKDDGVVGPMTERELAKAVEIARRTREGIKE